MNSKIQQWLAHCACYYTQRTCQQYKSVLNMFYSFCDTYPTYNDIVEYINYLKDNHSARTINNQLMAIRSFCHWCKSQFRLKNPLEKIKLLPVLPPKQRVLIDAEYTKVLSVCNPREIDFIQFLANTGLRASEILTLCPSWLVLENRHFLVQGKGRKQRTVPLNQRCLDILSRHPDCHIAPIKSVWRICRDLAKRAGVPHFGPHALRHYFATRLVRAGVPLIKVSHILGHSSVLITQKIYLHLLPVDYLGATDCLLN